MSFFTSPPKVYFYCSISIYLGLVFLFIAFPFTCNAKSLSYSCTLPYNAEITAKTAQIIAKSFAYTKALMLVDEDFKKNKAISMGLKDTNLHNTVAAELYTLEITNQPEEINTLAADVHVTVTLTLPENISDQQISNLLSSYDLLEMRLELLKLLDSYAVRGQELILISSGIQKNALGLMFSDIYHELQIITKKLEALWLYDKALRYFNITWSEPELVQINLQKATDLAPKIAALWAALGEVQLQLDQPQNALDSLNKALELEPHRARAYYIRGLGHLRLQQPTLAKADLNTALEYKPDEPAWLNARGAISLVLEDYVSMCDDFEKACGLGNCQGLIHARKRDLCLQ